MSALSPLATISLFIANILYWYEVVVKFAVGGLLGSAMLGEMILFAILLIVFIIIGFYIAVMSVFVLAIVYDYDY